MGSGVSCRPKHSQVDTNEVMKDAVTLTRQNGGHALHFTKLQVNQMAMKVSTMTKGETALTRNQFRDFFSFDEVSLDILFEAFDVDHSGTLELAEMISGMSFLCRGTYEEKLKFLFKLYDKDGSGQLDESEIMSMFNKLTDSLVRLEKARKPNRSKGLRSIQADVSTFSLFGSSRDNNDGSIIQQLDNVSQMQLQCEKLAASFKISGDLDGDGQISYEEFEHYMLEDPVCVMFLDVLAETTNELRSANMGI